MDHRLGQGIWRAGGVWKDTEDNEAKDVKEIEVRVSGRKKSKQQKRIRDETCKGLKKKKKKGQECESKMEKGKQLVVFLKKICS